eukprot:9469459-Pyramimonas_sp.AAC.1
MLVDLAQTLGCGIFRPLAEENALLTSSVPLTGRRVARLSGNGASAAWTRWASLPWRSGPAGQSSAPRSERGSTRR